MYLIKSTKNRLYLVIRRKTDKVNHRDVTSCVETKWLLSDWFHYTSRNLFLHISCDVDYSTLIRELLYIFYLSVCLLCNTLYATVKRVQSNKRKRVCNSVMCAINLKHFNTRNLQTFTLITTTTINLKLPMFLFKKREYFTVPLSDL